MNGQNNSDKGARKEKKKMKTPYKVLISVLCVIVALNICVVTTFAVLYFRGKKQALPDARPSIVPPSEAEAVIDGDDEDAVYYLGEKYRYNENIATCLVLGSDNGNKSENEVGAKGEADAVFLVAFDTQSGKVYIINISRDAMTDVDIFSTDGFLVRTERLQLCLAYDYGTDEEASSKNVAASVTRLLYGVPVTRYMSLDINAVSVITDAVGGVSVPEYNEKMSEKTGGTVTLYGEDAIHYIQRRDKSVLDSNNTRMQRQTDYIRSFAKVALESVKADITVASDLFGILGDYMTTDITPSLVTYYATNYITKDGSLTFLSLPGSVVEGKDGYAEFEVDPIKTFEMILSVFYIKE